MKKLKYLGLYLLFLLPTFFINFFEITIKRGFSLDPIPDSWNSPIFTSYPNFLMKGGCGGFSGKICSVDHFSFAQMIVDAVFALIFFGVVLLLVFIVKKLPPHR